MPISEILQRLTKCDYIEVLQQDWDARHDKKLHKIDVNSETERLLLFFVSVLTEEKGLLSLHSTVSCLHAPQSLDYMLQYLLTTRSTVS